MAEVNINIPEYPAAKAKGTAMIVTINEVPFFCKKGFDPETGEKITSEPVRITAKAVQEVLDQAQKDWDSVKAGCETLLADIQAAAK